MTMQLDGYVLFDTKTSKVVEVFPLALVDENGRPQLAVRDPESGIVYHSLKPGESIGEGLVFLESWREENSPPSRWHQRIGSSAKVVDEKYIQSHAYEEKPTLYPNKEEVNNERDRRIETSFPYMGKQIQFRPGDRENINGASSLAIIAIMNGAKPGDTKWHGGEEDFAWITADNSLLVLDAFQTIGMGKAAAEWKSKNIFAARELKNQDPIPRDFEEDKYWPVNKREE